MYVSFRRHKPLKLLLRCEVVDKRPKCVVLGSPVVKGMGTEITNMGFQTALTTEHVVVIGQRARVAADG